MATGTTVREALTWAASRLEGRVPSPGVEAEIVLEHVLGVRRAALRAHPDRRLSLPEAERVAGIVERRAGQEPLQYITGRQAFRGIVLRVGPGVLVPRPETEIVVEHALRLLEGAASPAVVDVGTGSGAIALAVAAERPGARVWGTEISPRALAWARLNREEMGAANVILVQGDMFSPLPDGLRGRVDLVVANPPYLPESMVATMPSDVRDHEPRLATVSGTTGLEVPARVALEAAGWLRPGGWLVMETWPGQAARLRALLAGRYEAVEVLPDLGGAARIAVARRPA